jgi:reverse gyrase
MPSARLIEARKVLDHTCLNCGGEILSSRSNTKYCSSYCRRRAQYMREKKAKVQEEARQLAQKILAYTKSKKELAWNQEPAAPQPH